MNTTSSTYQDLDDEWQALILQAESDPWFSGWPAFVELEQGFAWIQERKISAMRAVELYNAALGGVAPGACEFMLGGIGRRVLVDACVGGIDGLIYGRANGRGDWVPVPVVAWVDARLTVEDTGYVLGPLKTYEAHRTRWLGLRAMTSRLIEIWPPEASEVCKVQLAPVENTASSAGLKGKSVRDKPIVDAIAQVMRDDPALDFSKATRVVTLDELPDWERSSILPDSYNLRLRRLFNMLYDTDGVPRR